MDLPQCLCHIDANVDNFLIFPDHSAKLLDWEYAGMCDPLMDVSMCAIYSYYEEEQTEKLLELYLQRRPDDKERFITYADAALGASSGACGLYTRQVWEMSLESTPLLCTGMRSGTIRS